MLERVRRINRYFEALTHSFDIMVDGMDQGIPSVQDVTSLCFGIPIGQYRKIEICSTSIDRIAHKDENRERYANHTIDDIAKIAEHFYWREGAIEMKTGIKTLTLRQLRKSTTMNSYNLPKISTHRIFNSCEQD